MGDFDKIYDYVEQSTMILIINNNSKLLLDTLVNSIYKKCPLQKIKYEKCKGLFRKIEKVKDKIIKVDLDLNKIRFTSSNNPTKLHSDFTILQSVIENNKSKLIIKTDLSNYKQYMDIRNFNQNIVAFNVFDLIIFIDKEYIRLLRIRSVPWFNDEKYYPLDQLLRKAKLNQLKERLKKYENNS